MESILAVFFADIRPLAIMAAGYALFLLLSAYGLEWLARGVQRRSLRLRTAGFVYHRHLDVWECPQGQHLLPIAVDHERWRRVVRYRGSAQECNRCPLKAACTDSEQGREIVRPLVPWPYSEIGRFHRGLSLVLVLLASLIVLVTAGWQHRPHELQLLAGVLVCLGLAARQMLSGLLAQPVHTDGGAGATGLNTPLVKNQKKSSGR